jgi:ubiquitin-protein ligase
MDSCIKRLFKELNDNRKELNPCVLELEPVDEDDLLVWKCSLKGPQGTPYEGNFYPSLSYSLAYPFIRRSF